MQMIRFKPQLFEYLKNSGLETKNPNEMRIAVEALIFTPQGRLLLEKRGQLVRDEVGKLEGVGGSIGEHTDLHRALKERIENELGEQVNVKIDQLLEVRLVNFVDRDRGTLEWVIVSYLCQLVEGTPEICEPDMVDELLELTLDEFFQRKETDLSQSAILGRKTYQKRFGNRLFFAALED